MSEIKTLDVEVSFPDSLDVDVDFGQTLTKIVAPNPYEGATTVTPSDERQTLPTRGKYLSNNVVINPIPSNYGKISWNGSVLTVL